MAVSPHHKEAARQAFSDRLGESLKKSGRSTSPTHLVTEFNAHFGGPKVHVHTCRKWLHGEAIPTQEKLVVLSHMVGVSPDWLRYGQETRMMEQDPPSAFSRPELALLADFRRLNERDKRVVRDLVGLMMRST